MVNAGIRSAGHRTYTGEGRPTTAATRPAAEPTFDAKDVPATSPRTPSTPSLDTTSWQRRPEDTAPVTETPPASLQAHLTHFRRRVIEDALLEATAAYWRRRAADFAQVGTPTADETALACRRHAQLLDELGLDQLATAELDDVLGRIGKGAA